MKRIFVLMIVTFILSTLPACNNTVTDASGQEQKNQLLSGSNEKISIINQINIFYGQLDTHKLPTFVLDNNDVSWEQFIINDAVSHKLAKAVRNLLWNDKNIIEDFDDIKNIGDPKSFQLIALTRTPYIDGSVEGLCETYPNHILTYLIINETAEGRQPDRMYYIDDVKEVIRKMFGDKNQNMMNFYSSYVTDGKGIYYLYPREGVISIPGTAGEYRALPEITHYEKTQNGYICEVILVPPYNTISLTDGKSVEITSQNFHEYEKYLPKYRYTFADTEDNLTLTGLKTLYVPN